MVDKSISSAFEAIEDISNGMTIMIGGFGESGSPIELIHALIDHGVKDLTVVNNNAGSGEIGLAALIGNGQVKKIICSYPRSGNSTIFRDCYRAGKIDLELIPQGTLAERIRAGGAGIPAFFTPTGVDTSLTEGRETRKFEGRTYVMEHWLKADFALIKCDIGDRSGNLTYNKTARNFNPIMCTAAKTTVVQARRLVKIGEIKPEHVITPNIFVDRIVEITVPLDEKRLIAEGTRYP